MSLNPNLKTKIVRKLFADAEDAGWVHLADGQRSVMYKAWMDDPEVAGRLTRFMTADKARVWIKDGPMKEYTRARYGVGNYAKYVKNPAAGVGSLVERAIGPEWGVVPRSRKIKPLRVLVRRDEEERYFAWAPSAQLKHLVWAAIKAEAMGDTICWVLCLVGSFEQPTPADLRATNKRIGTRCHLDIIHVDDI